MLQLSQLGSLRLPVAVLALVFGFASVAAAQCNNSCIDRCDKKCNGSCSTCLSPFETDPSTRPLTMPDPPTQSPEDLFAFQPLQSTLLTPDSVSVPNMMGNLLRAYRGVTFQYLAAGDFAVANTSGSVSFRNTNVAENNSAIPRNRVSFRYNYFRNALTVQGLRNTGLQFTPSPPFAPGTPFLGVNPADVNLDAIAAVAGESRVARGVGDGTPTQLPGVAPAARDYDVHLYTFSAERTFYDDLMSIEIRVPYADTLSEDQDFTAGVVREDFLFQATPGRTLGSSGGELQDIQLILKRILVQDSCNRWVLSSGLGLSLPTGPDLNATVVDFSEDVGGDPGDFAFIGGPRPGFAFDQRIRKFKIENETFGLSPFLAMVMMPNEQNFFNGFIQLDLPLNKSDWRYSSIDRDLEVLALGAMLPGGAVQNIEQFSGSIRDQTLLQIDIGGGHWLYQNPCGRFITGLASILELHYTTTLQDADIVTVPAAPLRAREGDNPEPQPRLGNTANRVDILDLTVGGHIQFGSRATLAIGGVFPLRDGDDRTFDAELNVQFNIYR